MKLPWSKDPAENALVRSDDLTADPLGGEAAKQLVRAIAKRDKVIARRIESLVEQTLELAQQNRDLSKRTEAMETAVARLIQGQGMEMVRLGSENDEGSQLVRRHMRDIKPDAF